MTGIDVMEFIIGAIETILMGVIETADKVLVAKYTYKSIPTQSILGEGKKHYRCWLVQ